MSGRDERPNVFLRCGCDFKTIQKTESEFWVLKREISTDIRSFDMIIGWYLFDEFRKQHPIYIRKVLVEYDELSTTIEGFIEKIKTIECGGCGKKHVLGKLFDNILSEIKKCLRSEGYQVNGKEYSVGEFVL